MKRLSALSGLVLLACLCFFAVPCAAGDEKKPEVRDGKIYLPENNMPRIPLERLNLDFPKEMPKELLDMKGNIYRGELEGTSTTKGLKKKLSQVTYLVLSGYLPETKEAVMYFVWERGHDGRPSQGRMKGIFNPEGGTVLSTTSRAGMSIEYRLHFLKDGKLRINTNSGFSAEYSPVGKLP